jgi:hypothetical protein
MKKSILALTAIAGAVSIALIACQGGAKAEIVSEEISQDSLVKRGSYLVNAIGCDDCHSPKIFGPKGPEVIPELRFSGYPGDRPLQKAELNAVKLGWGLLNHDLTSAVGPWGASFSANISSDETGIGAWTESQFIKAIREGKIKGMDESRPMLPPMPWSTYKNLSDTDLKSIFAFLKTSKPIRNIVPAPIPLKDL